MSGMIPGAAGSQEPELEYATKGTSARLVETEAAIQEVRVQLHKPWKYDCQCCERIWDIVNKDGESDE